jgi:hypothetical protein
MYKRLFLGMLFMVGLLCASASALDPLGPPTAGLEQGQWSAGLEYSHSEMDLTHSGSYSWFVDIGPGFSDTVPFKYEVKNNKMNKAYMNVGYGITENWDAFLRLGGANVSATRTPMDTEGGDMTDSWLKQTDFDSDTGLAVGFGTRATVWKPSPKVSVGVLAQASWASVAYSVNYEGFDIDRGEDWGVQTEGDMDFWEIQVAAGANCQLADSFSVYGGPFYHWFDGEYDYKGVDGWWGDGNPMALTGSYDVEDDGCLGGFLGAQINMTENAAFNAEFQWAEGALAFGTGLVWRF